MQLSVGEIYSRISDAQGSVGWPESRSGVGHPAAAWSAACSS